MTNYDTKFVLRTSLKNFPYLKSYTNPAEFHLNSNKVLLVGGNGSGKTTFINSVELALTGEAHDLGVRDSAKASTILSQLIKTGEEDGACSLKITYLDQRGEWTIHRDRAAKHGTTGLSVVKPIQEAMAALKGSRVKTLEYLYALIPTNCRTPDNLLDTILKTRKNANSASADVKKLTAHLSCLEAGGNWVSSALKLTDEQLACWPATSSAALLKWQQLVHIEALSLESPQAMSHYIQGLGAEYFQEKIQNMKGDELRSPGWTWNPEKARIARDSLLKLKRAKHLHETHKLALDRQVETLADAVYQHSDALTRRIEKYIGSFHFDPETKAWDWYKDAENKLACEVAISIRITKSQCTIGYDHDNAYGQVDLAHAPCTSGAETVELATALGMAYWNHVHRKDSKKFGLFILPDRNIDQQKLVSLMEKSRAIQNEEKTLMIAQCTQVNKRSQQWLAGGAKTHKNNQYGVDPHVWQKIRLGY